MQVPAIISPPRTQPGPAPNHGYNDKYVVVYDAAGLDFSTAAKEFTALLRDLQDAGLHTEVRPGFGQSLLVFVKAPRELLGNTVYKSRVKDWLYGIVPSHPGGTKSSVVRAAYAAENLLAVHNLVNSPKDLGGAGITPGVGRWQNVRADFPLHDEAANRALLGRLSRRIVLRQADLDAIRDLFGTKIAFYFAFLQTYLVFLAFPAAVGLAAWVWLPKYSPAYAVAVCLWCSVLVEYWKVRETDLSLRWGVRGAGRVRTNRVQYRYERVIVDENGRTTYHASKCGQMARQLLQVPFVLVAAAALGALLACVCALEVLISETYGGPYKVYLDYLPTGLLAVALPCIGSALESVAAWITEFENHRTADQHEMALTQKIFALSIITNYLPILLIAFVYIPFGDAVVPHLEAALRGVVDAAGLPLPERRPFVADPDRLRNEVAALTVTGQLCAFVGDNGLPYLRNRLRAWYRQTKPSDDPDEAAFLARCRREAALDRYNVHDDVAATVLQFGHLALFAPAWPLLPAGLALRNWAALRADLARVCFAHRRPPPLRADGLGPWVAMLEILAWAGSLTTAAIVHLYSGRDALWSFPLTVFASEHALLAFRAVVRGVLRSLGSDEVRRERGQRYANRVRHLQEIEAGRRAGVGLSVAERERRRSVLVMGAESFWTKQVYDGASAAAGISLLKGERKGMNRRSEGRESESKLD